MLYGSEIGGEGWPVENMNFISLKKVLSKKSTVSPRVILLEKDTPDIERKMEPHEAEAPDRCNVAL